MCVWCVCVYIYIYLKCAYTRFLLFVFRDCILLFRYFFSLLVILLFFFVAGNSVEVDESLFQEMDDLELEDEEDDPDYNPVNLDSD